MGSMGSMSAAYVDPGLHQMTVDQYERFIAENGIDGVELIDGFIYDMTPEQNLHSRTIAKIFGVLLARYPDRQVNAAGSVQLDNGSLWNPDVYVVDVDSETVLPGYPHSGDLLIAVEVSVSTWRKDAGLKRDIYARNGIAEYWVVDPKRGGVVIRHTDPYPDGYGVVVSKPLPLGLPALADTWSAIETR